MQLSKILTASAFTIATILNSFAQEGILAADTLAVGEPAAEFSRSEMRKQRGISNMKNHIVPVGQWIFGGTLSYSTHSNGNYKVLVVEGIDSEGYTVKVSPFVGYSPIANSVVGIRFAYSRSLLNIDSARVNFGEGDSALNLSVDYYYLLEHSYDAIAVWRQYVPLGRNKRFALFAEFQLSLGGSQSKFAEGSPIRGTYSKAFNISAGVNPGLIAFLTNNMAVEINVGVLGINYSDKQQVHNRIDDEGNPYTKGNTSSSMMNFSLNIFSIGVGVAFYL